LEAIQRTSQELELLSPFESLIVPQMISEIRSFLPTGNPYAYKSADFVNISFPFDAYVEKIQLKREGTRE
jgi:hypothetical protein